jgi:hypothetical protein
VRQIADTLFCAETTVGKRRKLWSALRTVLAHAELVLVLDRDIDVLVRLALGSALLHAYRTVSCDVEGVRRAIRVQSRCYKRTLASRASPACVSAHRCPMPTTHTSATQSSALQTSNARQRWPLACEPSYSSAAVTYSTRKTCRYPLTVPKMRRTSIGASYPMSQRTTLSVLSCNQFGCTRVVAAAR